MSFPLSHLPIELALDILRLAASPVEQDARPTYTTTRSPYPIYQTARVLALVSHSIRQVIMPHLLHTVVIHTQESLNLFIRTLHEQKELTRTGSRLSIDYPRVIRHFWSSRCWEPIMQQYPGPIQSYNILSEIFCNTETLGFTFASQHLLYEALGGPCSPSVRSWSCKRLTFAGINPRWNPLTSTRNGQAFLQQLTHLTVWLPKDDTLGPPSPFIPNSVHRVPNWVQRIPFESMPNLTHFAFTVADKRMKCDTTFVLLYVMPPSMRQQQNSTIFRTWAMSSEPLSFGKMLDLNLQYTWNPNLDDRNWGMTYLHGGSDRSPPSEESEQKGYR